MRRTSIVVAAVLLCAPAAAHATSSLIVPGASLGPVTSVFVGGGTPTRVPASDLASVLAVVPLAPGAEVTVECNPDAVDLAKLVAYRGAGVTRLSFGVQSMTAHVLAFLDRTHDPANVARAVGWARDAGFDSFNLDLIYGTPGESIDDWRNMERQ